MTYSGELRGADVLAPLVFAHHRTRLAMAISSVVLARLAALQDVALSPLRASSLDAWRDQVAAGLRDLIGGTACQFSLAPVIGGARMRSPDIAPALVDEYVATWLPRDPILRRVSSHRTRIYARSAIARATPEVARRYLRSALFNEFYRPHGHLDAVGLVRAGRTFAQVMVFTDRFGDERTGEDGQQLVRLVAPAILAGVDAVAMSERARSDFVGSIDQWSMAVAVYDARGVLQHRNPAFARWHDRQVASRHITDAAAMLARRLGPSRRRPELVMPVLEVPGAELVATRVPMPAAKDDALIMIMVRERVTSPDARSSMPQPAPDPEAPAAASPLTARQLSVARLVMVGLRNDAIADALGISPSTARRHTEQVLARLGVPTRAGVGTALRRLGLA